MSLARLHSGLLLLLMLSTLGCACHSGSSCKHGSSWCNNPGNPCHGYYSTCWREWPCECERCPPFTLGLLEGAVLLDQEGQEPLPPTHIQPQLPSPTPSLPQAIEPPPAETSQSQRPVVPHRPAGGFERPASSAALPPATSSAQENLLVSANEPLPQFNNLRETTSPQRQDHKQNFSNATFQGTLLGN